MENLSTILFYVGIFMIIFYLAVGSALIAGMIKIDMLAPQYQSIFGVLLIFYGIFRASKTYQAYKNR